MALLREDRSRTRRTLAVAAALALVAVIVAAVGLLRSGGALGDRLSLVALGADGRFGADVELAPRADGQGYPLVFAVVNEGRRSARPRSLRLALPAWFRITGDSGDALPAERSEGDPLAHFRLPLPSETVEPGVLPLVPAGLDKLRLEPVLASIDCSLSWNGVPAFESAPPWDLERLSQVTIYWAFDGGGGRLAGLLRLRIPQEGLLPAPVPTAFGELTAHAGDAPRPDVGALTLESDARATCGEPERPLELRAVGWKTASGGRLVIVMHEGQPRLHLFDLDGDGNIDLEIQDTDNDGVFESRRTVSYPIPAFLIPRR